ncbi:helix-turn-helix domain-containing protein [Pseudomonas aeruginosa]|uniref:helix-turn-helix domain-containing protein n=1 Tax=Gammaproteobacteria TaxID=1236 RepID=UPI001FAE9921|nr:helix-turn-helix transcriptional regulator [Pseudomonas aeruginosa]
MSATEHAQQSRLLTPTELAACIKLFREMRQWSQEQLSAISGLNVRTIQRVEQGQVASLDTRRALARAFELEDIDALNKPFVNSIRRRRQGCEGKVRPGARHLDGDSADYW